MTTTIRSLAFLLALALTGCASGPMMKLLGDEPKRGPADIMTIEMDTQLDLKGLILTWDAQITKNHGMSGDARESNCGLFVFPVPAGKPVRLYGIWWSEDRRTRNFCGEFKVWRNNVLVDYKKYVYENPNVPCIYTID